MKKYFFLLFVIVLTTRWITLFYPLFDTDEPIFANAGRAILNGFVLYRDFIDHKPPLVYYLYTFFLWIVNDMRFVHAMTLFWVFISAVVFYFLMRCRYEEKIARVGGLLYALFISTISLATTAETLMNLPVLLSLLFFFRNSFFLSGLFIGLASLIKPQAIVAFAPMVLVLFLEGGPHRFRALVFIAAGLVAAYLPFVFHQWHLHNFSNFITWVYLENFRYLHLGPKISVWRPLLESILTAVFAGSLVLWWFAVKHIKDYKISQDKRTLLFGILWLVVSIGAVSMGLRFYRHYFIQLTPVLVFLAAPLMTEGLKQKKKVLLFFTLAPAVGISLFFSLKALLQKYAYQRPSVKAAITLIRQKTKPDDFIFTWGNFAVISYLADRRESSPFAHCSMPLGNLDPCHLPEGFDVSLLSKDPHYKEMLESLEARPPAVIVDLQKENIKCWRPFRLKAFKELDDFVTKQYHSIGEFGGIVVYAR